MSASRRDPLTLEELKAWPEAYVTPAQASKLLGCDRYTLNVAAKAGRLSIPHVMVGNRLKLSKAALLEFCGVGMEEKPCAR